MAKVKITGHASGTGILTVTAPNTSTDRTITLPDATGTLLNSDGSGASLTALNATQLTSGTVPDARFPATLPAASGVNLTALNATNLGSGTVPTARLGSGTASSSTILYGDQTYKTAPSGGLVLVASSVDMTGGGTTYASIIIDQCFTTDYENYLVVGGFGVEANGNCRVQMRIGGSGSESTYTTGNYKYVGMDYENENASLTKNGLAHDTDTEFPIAIDVTPSISDGNFFNMWVYSPTNTSTDTILSLQMSSYDAQNDARDRRASCNVGNVDATGLFFANSSGNLDEHAIYVYGLVKS